MVSFLIKIWSILNMLLKVRDIFKSYFITLILLSLLLIPLFPQNYNIKTFTTKDGLPHDNVRAIAEDSTGFLWIGTWDGLSRYDGYEFRNYYHIPGDTNSISYFSIRSLVVDHGNNLWILTHKYELLLYDRINDNFRRISDFGENDWGQIINICADTCGELWIICKNALLKRNFNSRKFIHYCIINGNGGSYSLDQDFLGIYISDSTKIWLSGSSVYEFEFKNSKDSTGKLIIKNVYNLESSFLKEKIDFEFYSRFSFYESPTGSRWVFSNIGLFKLNEEKSAFYEYKGTIGKNEFKGNRNFDWSWPEEGLYSYDPVTHITRVVKSEISQLMKVIHHKGRDLLWFANTTRLGTPLGLTQLVFTNSFFRNYIIKTDKDQLAAVYSIVKDEKNNLWAGVRGMDHIIQFTPDNRIKKTGQVTPELFKLSGHIRSMIRVKEGIWIGYYSDLLLFYNFKSGRFIRHFPDEKIIRNIAVSQNGNLYIGADNLSLYNPESGKTELLWKSPRNRFIFKLFLNDKDILWAGLSTKTLLKYNTVNKESTVYSISDENYNIEDICPGKKNDLWIATLGEGLCNFDAESGKTTYYTTSSGLSNNTTYRILKDKSGNIWVSTDNGISKLNPETGRIRVFNTTDGVGITEFNSDASYVADDGEFFFGGMGGLVGFYPDSLSETDNDIKKLRILLTGFTVSGEKKILQKNLNDSDTITLFKGENNFQLSFSSTDFINSDKTLFRYRLAYINKSWIETNSHNRTVNYSNLKPGRYTFEIQATNPNGEWAVNKKIILRITPFFYQTRLFLITVPLFMVLVLTGIIILYIRQLKQRERQKQNALKLQSLRGQMNPHFIFNSLNSINYFISNNDKLSANRYIADFSRLIRSILSNLGSDYIPFDNEINSIKDYLNIEHLRFGDKFDFEIRIDDISDKSNLEVFPGLVQPFIENAIWHGIRALENRKGFILIKFSSPGPNRISCLVEDDGIGREAALRLHSNHENHKSRGINIVIERLQLISKLQGVNYNFEITDLYPGRKETGTRVEIDIPAKSIKKE